MNTQTAPNESMMTKDERERFAHAHLARRHAPAFRPKHSEEEARYQRAKSEQLPSALAALKNAREKLHALESRIHARQDEMLSRKAVYSIKAKASDAAALEAAQSKVADLEKEVAHWSKVVSDFENGEALRDFQSIHDEIADTCQRGNVAAQALLIAFKGLLKKFDVFLEFESLFQRSCRQLSRCRTELLRSGVDVPFTETLHFCTDSNRILRFVNAELPKRPRTDESEWPKHFPGVVFEQDASPEADGDSALLPEEDDAPRKPSKRKPRRKSAKRSRKTAKKRASKPAQRAPICKPKQGRCRAKAA